MSKTIPDFDKEAITNLPHIIVSGRRLYDLEMLLNGGFAPLTGFLDEDDYHSVVADMHLTTGELWPIPIVLDISESEAKTISIGDDIVLTDPYSKPLAIMTVSSKYRPDKKKEVKHVYGTDDTTHFGVRYILENTEDVYLGGKVEMLSLPERHDFKEHRRTPEEQRKWFKDNGWDKVVAFQTRNPIHRAHFELIKRAARDLDAKALIHPVVGETKDGDIDAFTRINVYKKIKDNHAKDFADLNLLPLAMRMAGPREALWHALIRKNYGATHFIVGRDHAGPGNDKNGNPFYGPNQAVETALKYEDELGIGIYPSKTISYVPEEDKYMTEDELEDHHTTKNISGTEVREKLRNGDKLPEWFSFPEVVEELQRSAMNKINPGFTIFFTGLSGSGKSTIASVLQQRLLEMQPRSITLLDGDIVRLHLSKGLGFSKEDRDANVKRIGFVAAEATKHGGIAITAAIAPYAQARQAVRRMVESYGTFIEVHVSTPIEVCEERDVKGLYAKAKAGIITGFTGVDDPYEEPNNPEITINTEDIEPQEAVDYIIDYLKERSLI